MGFGTKPIIAAITLASFLGAYAIVSSLAVTPSSPGNQGLFSPAEAASGKGPGGSGGVSSNNDNSSGSGNGNGVGNGKSNTNNSGSSASTQGSSNSNSNNNNNSNNVGTGGQGNSQNQQGGSNGNTNSTSGSDNFNTGTGNSGGGGSNNNHNQSNNSNNNGNNGPTSPPAGPNNNNNNGNGANTQTNNDNPINAKARAIQGGTSIDSSTAGVVGSAISCYGGIDSTAGADSAICYLLPDGVPTPDYKTDPSVISQVMTAVVGSCPAGAGFTPTDKCFVTTYDQSLFHPGDWRFVVEFYKNGSLINLAGIDYRVHTFFVLPESPMGAAALTGSSLASLGAFVLHKKRKSKQSPPPSNDHSLGQ